jgi:hypothetical protein
MKIKTVRVVSPVSEANPLGYIVINESDLTEDHELFVDAETQSDEPRTKRKYTKRTED